MLGTPSCNVLNLIRDKSLKPCAFLESKFQEKTVIQLLSKGHQLQYDLAEELDNLIQ